ncbi:MAG: response regulator [Leptospiraceae bacterium]|nr:response regulator [Leptospiraceae bacterium]MCP5501216.1 response regulator [Leptospiraceae bacterium]
MALHNYTSLFPILLAEDVPENQKLLAKFLKKMELNYRIFSNGKEALESLSMNEYSIFIVDLMMPVMGGKEFIENLKKRQPEAIILVQTSIDSSNMIIDVMKLGVFDYILKPVDPDLFEASVLKALEFKRLKEVEKSLSYNTGLKLRSQIEWLNYKDLRTHSDKDSKDITFLKYFMESMGQKNGLGQLIGLVDIISSGMKEAGDDYLVSKQLMDLLIQSSESSQEMIDRIVNISDILEERINLSSIEVIKFLSFIPLFIEKIKPYLEAKSIELKLPSVQYNYKLNIHLQKVGEILEELLINACKYSDEKTKINILAYTKEGYFCIAVMNNPKKGAEIPKDMEKLLLEPFFRYYRGLENVPKEKDPSPIEKFPIGLGLSVVDNIMKKHNGLFFIYQAIDHTSTAGDCVMAELLFPLQK